MRTAIIAGLWAVGLLAGCGGSSAEEGLAPRLEAQALDPVEACLEAWSVALSNCLHNATTPEQQERCERIGASCPRKCSRDGE
ncbi:hypothetical protein [Corallococcus carmarthensis]|uniref:hypothetical protein n=1 Tax=Corallococcus carmarthensis TaxID=2316728 RepID=UPI00148DFFC1|nr:hypothetical protein [Corallococcus carmarthensis]NOK17564.1 hypothetical protein [Corallococcus carmarthensis]